MGFLDNSGDIILDAVLTDTGRYRMSRGDGSFKIRKFALGDDEINYELYDKNHPSGSAYYDLEIMQTPVLEAFTNNTATMNSKLITIARTNLLYLPILKLNGAGGAHREYSTGGFMVAVDSNTEKSTTATAAGFGNLDGVIRGYSLDGNFIRVDQGLDTTEMAPAWTLGSDLNEVQYLVEMDNRLGRIVTPSMVSNGGGKNATKSFIDDDNIASYFLTLGDTRFVMDNTVKTDKVFDSEQVIAGPRGTLLTFSIGASIELNQSDFLFDQLGTTWAIGAAGNPTGQVVKYIDTIVKVTGVTTGYRLDIPIRYVKTPT